MKKKNLLVLLLLGLAPSLLFSQINSKQNNNSNSFIGIGLDAGVTIFSGDLDEGAAQGDLFNNNQAFRLSIYKNLGSVFLLDGQAVFGNISGEKKRGTIENLSYQYFNTEFNEFTINIGINILNLVKNNPNRKFNAYILGGVGLINFRTKLSDGVSNEIVSTKGYDGQEATTELVIPVGIQASYNVTDNIALFVQTSSRIVDTDKLDGKEGNSNRDYYNYASIGFVYKFTNNSSSKGESGGFNSKKTFKNRVWKKNKQGCELSFK